MAGKIICSVCGQTHPPAGCKQKVAKRKPQTQKIAALNILSVTANKK
jgi:hypothetical protein